MNKDSSFVGFKPNAYVSKEREISKTIDTRQSCMIEDKDPNLLFDLNYAFKGFYGNKKNLNVYNMNITFASKSQDFYSKSNYTEFNFVSGLDNLPPAEMSLFIKLVIIIGSGLSLLVLLIFPVSICLMAKKMKGRRDSALLNNQDSIY